MTGLPRRRTAELMDQPDPDPAELERSLEDLRRVNRWLGGTRAVLRTLVPMMERLDERPVRVLDVATGSADIPRALARWARRRGERIRVVATDVHPRTLETARRETAPDPEIEVRAADALELPFADGSFHFAVLATALHHFDQPQAVAVLRELDRVASHGVVVSDLRRSRPALLGARALAATVWRRHPITRHDGPASVRAAFTPAELRKLAASAGLRGARVWNNPLFRVSLVLDRTGGGR